MLELTIIGEPVSKARPRATIIGGHAHIYTPNKTAGYEAKVAFAFQQKYPDYEPTTKPITVAINAYFQLNKGDYNTKGLPNKKGLSKLNGFHTKKPDCDNIAKSVLDGMNGIAFVDDSQITKLIITKQYALKPKVSIFIEESLDEVRPEQ